MTVRKASFSKRVMCLLPGFNQNQLGEDIIKSEDPDLCCTKKCVIQTLRKSSNILRIYTRLGSAERLILNLSTSI